MQIRFSSKHRMVMGLAAMFFGLTAASAPPEESFLWQCNHGTCCTDVDEGYVCRDCPDDMTGEYNAITIVAAHCGPISNE